MTDRTFGPAYDAERDGERVASQMERVREYMVREYVAGAWRTLSEISAALEARWEGRFPEASVSAQLRHLRKQRFGGWRVEKRLRAGTSGLYEYTIAPPRAGAGAGQGLLFETHRVR